MTRVVALCILAWIGVTLGIAVRRAIRALFKGEKPVHRTSVRGAFPVLPPRDVTGSRAPVMVENIRRFRVVGVDAMKTSDVAYVVDAASAENAKVKAELAGVIVTKVVEVADPPQPPPPTVSYE